MPILETEGSYALLFPQDADGVIRWDHGEKPKTPYEMQGLTIDGNVTLVMENRTTYDAVTYITLRLHQFNSIT